MIKPDSGRTEASGADHPCAFDELASSCENSELIHFRELVEVSDSLMAGYAKFIRRGLPSDVVGAAMLGATINLYEIFDKRAELPALLRKLADRIEGSAKP